MLLQWNDSYSVGIDEIDQQHQKLINNLNELHDAISAGEGREMVEEILDNVLDYTSYHFASEEKLMSLHSFPGYEEHRAEHEKLNRSVINMIKEQNDNDSIAMPLKVMQFLKLWVSDHILKTDKLYGPFLNDKGVF